MKPFRSVNQMTKKPLVFGGLALLAGYFWAAVRRVERPVSAELMDGRPARLETSASTITGRWERRSAGAWPQHSPTGRGRRAS